MPAGGVAHGQQTRPMSTFVDTSSTCGGGANWSQTRPSFTAGSGNHGFQTRPAVSCGGDTHGFQPIQLLAIEVGGGGRVGFKGTSERIRTPSGPEAARSWNTVFPAAMHPPPDGLCVRRKRPRWETDRTAGRGKYLEPPHLWLSKERVSLTPDATGLYSISGQKPRRKVRCV